MAYDIERITKEFFEICESVGVYYTTPVNINGRLTKTLGRVSNVYDEYEETWIPDHVDFSKHFIENATDGSIYSVIQHEAAHFIATVRSGETHGHDAYFKKICKEIGCSNDGTTTKVEKTVANEEYYRYTVDCEYCGFVGGYSRMCPTLRNINMYMCSCGGKLSFKKNW